MASTAIPARGSSTSAARKRRARERREHDERTFNDLWRTVPTRPGQEPVGAQRRTAAQALLGLPQENILYFLEKSAPRLAPWQRELLRIVRQIAQYFYPQGQTKVMNEGTATYVHYRIMNRLHEARRHFRRRFPRIPAVAHQCRFPAGLRRPALFRLQPLCARLCDDARHRADRHRTRRRGSAMVPRNRRRGRCDAGPARHLGQLSRRELHQPISKPAPDAADAHVPASRRSRPDGGHSRRGDP